MMGRRPGMTFEQRERAIGMLASGLSARETSLGISNATNQ